jgi:hypothetical protein
MKTDMLTKILLCAIALFLGMLALKPLVNIETVQAIPNSFDHIESLGGFASGAGPVLVLLDTRNGDVWTYDLALRTAGYIGKFTELGQPLAEPVQQR